MLPCKLRMAPSSTTLSTWTHAIRQVLLSNGITRPTRITSDTCPLPAPLHRQISEVLLMGVQRWRLWKLAWARRMAVMKHTTTTRILTDSPAVGVVELSVIRTTINVNRKYLLYLTIFDTIWQLLVTSSNAVLDFTLKQTRLVVERKFRWCSRWL